MVDAGEVETVLRPITFTHPNTTDETDLTEHPLLTEKDTHYFDLSELTQITTIRAFEKSDGITYKQISQREFPTDFETGTDIVIVVLDGAGFDMKVTLQSAVAETAPRTILGTVRDEIRK